MQTTIPTTWDDVERMPDDGNRYEWIAERLYMTPAPAIRTSASPSCYREP